MIRSFDLNLSSLFPSGEKKGRHKMQGSNGYDLQFNPDSERTESRGSRRDQMIPTQSMDVDSILHPSDTDRPMEVFIPISSSFEKNPQQNQQLHQLLKAEFATRYLLSIHVDPTQANVKKFVENMPEYTTFFRKGNGDHRFLVLRLTGNNTSKRKAPKNRGNRAAPSRLSNATANRAPMEKKEQLKPRRVSDSTPPVRSSSRSGSEGKEHKISDRSITEREQWIYQLARNAIYSTGSSTSPGLPSEMKDIPDPNSTDSEDRKEKQVITQLEGFETYSKRFLYPYNQLNSLPQQKRVFGVEKQIYDLENDFTKSIHHMIHQQRKDHVRSRRKKYGSQADATPTPTTVLDDSVFDVQKRTTSMKKRQPSSSLIHPLNRTLSHASQLSTTLLSPTTETTTESIFPKDHLSHQPPDELRQRFEELFLDENDSRSDMEIILDKELEKPPYLDLSEIKAMQEQFTRNFPLRMWKKKLSLDALQNIKKVLSSGKLTEFIRNMSVFSYWIFLGEFAAETNVKRSDVDEQFLLVYEEVLLLLHYNKQQQLRQVLELPIIILCIRVSIEGIFQTCYPNFWPSVFGRNLMKRLEILVNFLLDPQSYMSNLALIQSSIEERKLSKVLTKKMKQSGNSLQSKQNFVSPIVQYIIQEPSSLGTKKMFTTREYETDNSRHLVISQLFNHDYVRARLLSIITNVKKGQQPSYVLGQRTHAARNPSPPGAADGVQTTKSNLPPIRPYF